MVDLTGKEPSYLPHTKERTLFKLTDEELMVVVLQFSAYDSLHKA